MPAETQKLEKQTRLLFGLILFLMLLVGIVLLPNLGKFAERLKSVQVEHVHDTVSQEEVSKEVDLAEVLTKLQTLENERQSVAAQLASMQARMDALSKEVSIPKTVHAAKYAKRPKIHRVKTQQVRIKKSEIQESSVKHIAQIWATYCKVTADPTWYDCGKVKG